LLALVNLLLVVLDPELVLALQPADAIGEGPAPVGARLLGLDALQPQMAGAEARVEGIGGLADLTVVPVRLVEGHGADAGTHAGRRERPVDLPKEVADARQVGAEVGRERR